jgi:hypothetical protein
LLGDRSRGVGIEVTRLTEILDLGLRRANPSQFPGQLAIQDQFALRALDISRVNFNLTRGALPEGAIRVRWLGLLRAKDTAEDRGTQQPYPVADSCKGGDYEYKAGETANPLHGSTRLEWGFVRQRSVLIEMNGDTILIR